MRQTLLTLILLLCSAWLPAVAQNSLYEQYINRYSSMAVDQMNRYRIPASITLAQGLLESSAGTSRLARQGNNHFGIKCGGSWRGRYMLVNDDAPNERFRVYSSVRESYEDHSRFLTENRRYAGLFRLSTTDYKGWAHGLKSAGYATNPRYASLLINVIEKYDLTRFDQGHGRSRTSRRSRHAQESMQVLKQLIGSHPIRKQNGQYYIVAQEGDTYKKLAKLTHKRQRKLRRYNDADKYMELHAGDIVYLGSKKKKADKALGTRVHTMQAGETLYQISQKYGIKLASLCKMNPISPDYRFREGDQIRIR